MTSQAQGWASKREIGVITKLAAGAAISTLISTLIAIIPVRLVSRDAAHLLFVVAARTAGLAPRTDEISGLAFQRMTHDSLRDLATHPRWRIRIEPAIALQL